MKKFSFKRMVTERGISAEERRGVLEHLFVFGKENQTPFLIRMSVLLVLSTIIATAGLLSDSAAVVIGAMLVAPLMNPVMAAAGSVVMGWPHRFYGALWLVFMMGLVALLLSALLSLLSPELIFIPEQVLARTRPTYYDLLIALAAGAAGAYTIARKESGAIPGVAVAVALLPPLASAGILITAGDYELATRAIVLFLTNLVAMILSGALTFMAVGVSPPSSRKKTAVFVKSQIGLFITLTIAISVPLWFYSEKVLFNAHYQAAKSEILQKWLLENKLELVDVDMFRETQTLMLSLIGPNQPTNVGKLYQQLMDSTELEAFTIEYNWTQKVSGVWPQQGTSISSIAKIAVAKKDDLVNMNWVWTSTQYDIDTTAIPRKSGSYTLLFKKNDKFQIFAACGKLNGTYTFGGRSLDIKLNRNLFSGCRKDDVLKIFVEDLDRARTASLEDGELRIAMAAGEGIMFFEKKD
jgi:uncharacterized hydrophobic protein (TIGR00271 family)